MARTLAAALVAIENELRAFDDVRELNRGELSSYKIMFAAGWEIPGLIDGSELRLRVLMPTDGPYAPPRIAAFPPPQLLSWPHLEEHGLLCILREDVPHRLDTPGLLVLELLKLAIQLVRDGSNGTNSKDFESEFYSYWTRWPKCKETVESICRHDGPSRMIALWQGSKRTCIADSSMELERWLERRFAMNPRDVTIRQIPFVRLSRAPHPSEYPNTAAQLLDLVGRDNVALITEHFVDTSIDAKSVIAVAETTSGQALFGFSVAAPAKGRMGGGQGVRNGFRTVPSDIVLTRYKGQPVTGIKITRMDSSWVHGRDRSIHLPLLSRSKIVVAGLGSLGSGVATLLAKAGVGSLSLIDDGVFASENVSRHELGMDSVGAAKADALTKQLQKRFPHLDVASFPISVQQFADKHGNQLEAADVVISATADWGTECWLNAWAREHRRSLPTIFAWLEPHAIAGHAIVAYSDGPCFQCLFGDLGKMLIPVTAWKNRTTHDIPACAGEFQPYGAIELSQCQALTSELVQDVILRKTTGPTHRVWIDDASRLLSLGGEWSSEWVSAHGEPSGNGMKTIEYAPSTLCREHDAK